MSLSDCVKCWDTPCQCGYEYRKWSDDQLVSFLTDVTAYIPKERALRLMTRSTENRARIKDRHED